MQSTLKESGVTLPVLRVEYLHTLFGVLPQGRFFCSLSFIYSIIYLYHCVLMNICFMIWIIIQYMLFTFLHRLFPLWPLEALAVGSRVPLTQLQHRGAFFFKAWPQFLALSAVSGLSPIFPALFFLLENGSGNQDLGARSAYCYWCAIASRPSQLMEQENTYVYTSAYIYMYP